MRTVTAVAVAVAIALADRSGRVAARDRARVP